MLTRKDRRVVNEKGRVLGHITFYKTGLERVPDGWRIDWCKAGWEWNGGSAENTRRCLEQIEHVIELHNLY